MQPKFHDLLAFVRSLYPSDATVPLHAPRFLGREKEYLSKCIDSTFVSYVGEYVTEFENHVSRLTGAKHAIAMVNGTAALQMSLAAAGISPGDEVITQALTFVATPNAIRHAGGEPVFVDVDKDTLGMSPNALRKYLEDNATIREGRCFNKGSGQRIFAAMPMHTFGLAARVSELAEICLEWKLLLIEDAAESLGTWSEGKHTGTFGIVSVLSFNGNKPVTTGGGGMLFTNDDQIATRARHITTTAKRKHPWEFFHDELGWNLRMPNVNAAIGCAQMETIATALENKRETARRYQEWGSAHGVEFVKELTGTQSNYWLNAIVLENRQEQSEFLEVSNKSGVQTRPIWVLSTRLPMYESSLRGELANSEWLADRVVNVPSSVRI